MFTLFWYVRVVCNNKAPLSRHSTEPNPTGRDLWSNVRRSIFRGHIDIIWRSLLCSLMGSHLVPLQGIQVCKSTTLMKPKTGTNYKDKLFHGAHCKQSLHCASGNLCIKSQKKEKKNDTEAYLSFFFLLSPSLLLCFVIFFIQCCWPVVFLLLCVHMLGNLLIY